MQLLDRLKKLQNALCCPTFRNGKSDNRQRLIRANDPVYNNSFNYANNHISTSKYNVLTFLPKNLFEQFQRVANLYFLGLLILQLIPVISSLSPLTTILPLAFVLVITGVKDATDDIRRCRSDNEVNKRPTLVLRGGKLVRLSWDSVKVGDIIQLKNDDFVTADLFIVSTSESSGLCYIETAELDGETNLKVRQALEETAVLNDDLEALSKFDGLIECEPPNNNLNKFEGRLTLKNRVYPLDNDCMLLRGCRLRNTSWCFGIVIYAGADTKLMKNSGKPMFKRTEIDKILNKLIIGIFGFLITACVILMIGCGIFESFVGYFFESYLPWENFASKAGRYGGATIVALLNFLSYVIVLNTVVPISLYVSLEIIRLVQSKWIDWDITMYNPLTDVPAKSRTTTLNEELGKVQYIFSDKTGTLTMNVMTFKMCSINGVIYGQSTKDDEEISFAGNCVDLPRHPYLDTAFEWYDSTLIDALKRMDRFAIDFFVDLALCHTVMPERKNGKLSYQAQSPDEGALVSAARNFGIVFLERTPSSITILLQGRKVVYEVLNILDFNNERKRMSIIVKRKGKNQILLYCKGADNKIRQLLNPSCNDLWITTEDHLNRFSTSGFRTLCLARKVVDNSFYQSWAAEYNEAATALEDREEKLSKVYEKIENGLDLIGATAIEDKLQDGVSECISNLLKANIKIWVLTGDKLETAINIGLACKLLTDGMDLFTIESEDITSIQSKITEIKHTMIDKISEVYDYHFEKTLMDWESFCEHLGDKINTPADGIFDGFALAVSGQSLVYALEPSIQSGFLEVASFCKSVICCRVTPLQKAQVVELVKSKKKAITLAIGDGANDVSMIQRAHIGIGISGKEGRQAVLASDYSFNQFRYLENLLLIHGRWSYLRICKFLRYFFYKNFTFTLCNFWFAFFCGFSAQALFDPFFIATYNVFFTSLPVLALGVFDQDINAENSLRYPQLYIPGQRNIFFNTREFAISVLHGVLSSMALFFVPYLCFYQTTYVNGSDAVDIQSFGFSVAITLTIVVNLQSALDTYYWTGVNHFFIWGTIIACFLFHFALYSTVIWAVFKVGYYYVGVAQSVLSNGRFWFTCLLTCTICLLPVYGYRFYRTNFRPTATDEARYKQKFGIELKPKEVKLKRRLKIRRRWFRSGYAFSHSEGFGHLIKAGVMMKKVIDAFDPKKEGAKSSKAGESSTNESIDGKWDDTGNNF